MVETEKGFCNSQAANGVIALVAKALKRDKERFSSTTGGTVSEGGKQQRYKNFSVSGQKGGRLQESLHRFAERIVIIQR